MLCQSPGCNKSTYYNGHPGYCSRTCRDKSTTPQYTCQALGCSKLTFNGLQGYCSMICRDNKSNAIFDKPIGFYFPGRETPIDQKYKALMLGNFFPVQNLMIIAPNWEKHLYFSNAEAGFQALKYEYSKALLFCNDTGKQAFNRKKLLSNPNFANSGFDNNWKAMLHVLRAKFNNYDFYNFLLNTGNSFLIEHNSQIGRDLIWSNNNDGTGYNWLGFQLMWIRAEFNNATQELELLGSMFNIETGEFKNKKEWTDLVMHFTRQL